MQDIDIKRNGLLVGYGAVVPDEVMCAGGRVVIYGGAVTCHNFALVDSLGHRIAPEVWKTPVQIFDNGSFDVVGNAQTGGSDPVADW